MKNVKTPKGTRDYSPEECKVLSTMLNNFIRIFNLHGSVNIDTPTFELKDTLTNKYGEDSKLIFDLADQGGEICSLRYDLTVSFARYLATCVETTIKRYQIGKVFRRDNISINKGRMREFIQCDFDIAGKTEPMFADAECIFVAKQCLDSLGMKYKIKINSRTMLACIFNLCGIDNDKFSSVCSSIDKLDKMKVEDVKNEIRKKGCKEEQIEKLFEYLSKSTEFVDEDENLDFIKEINELKLLMKYLRCFGADCVCEIDFSLARGLDYYTGIIFEAVLIENKDVGSVAGGGRYDKLVSSVFDDKKDIPCVGFSLGINRLLGVLMERKIKRRICETKVYLIGSGSDVVEERMILLKKLWDNGIAAETYYTGKKRFGVAKEIAIKKGVDFILIVGEKEFKENSYKIMFGDLFRNEEMGSFEEILVIIRNNNNNNA